MFPQRVGTGQVVPQQRRKTGSDETKESAQSQVMLEKLRFESMRGMENKEKIISRGQ